MNLLQAQKRIEELIYDICSMPETEGLAALEYMVNKAILAIGNRDDASEDENIG